GMDLQAEEARTAGLIAGTFARLGKQRHEQRTGWPERNGGHQGREGAGGRQRSHLPAWAGAGTGDLAVPESPPVWPSLQGIAAADNPGVEARHHEWPGPHLQLAVVADRRKVALFAEGRFPVTVGAQGVRVGDHPAVARTRLDVPDLAEGG